MKLVVDFILITGILLNLVILTGLIRLKTKKLPQQILIVFWLFVLVNILHSYTALHNLRNINRVTFILEDGSRFVIAPLIYMYIKSIFLRQNNFLRGNLKHFIPFLLYFILYTIPRLINIYSESEVFSHIAFIHQSINMPLIKDVFVLGYCMISLQLFYKVKRNMKQHYSDIKEKDLSWLQIFLLSMTAVILVDLMITLSEIFFDYNVLWDDFITLTFLIIAMFYLGFNGLKQSTIYLPNFLGDTLSKYSSYSVLQPSESDALRSKIDNCLQQEAMYLDPDLTLRLLAESTAKSERQLSAFLNNEMQLSFYDLINSYRIEEAKKRLLSKAYDNHTIEGIGYSCGFKSRSSFFKLFKKNTGISPSAYKKSMQH